MMPFKEQTKQLDAVGELLAPLSRCCDMVGEMCKESATALFADRRKGEKYELPTHGEPPTSMSI